MSGSRAPKSRLFQRLFQRLFHRLFQSLFQSLIQRLFQRLFQSLFQGYFEGGHLGSEKEVAELGEGEENDEEHDGESCNVLGALHTPKIIMWPDIL